MISLVLPTYNPGPAIEETWRAVQQFVEARARLAEIWEVLFVLDGCTDDTLARLTALANKSGPLIRVVSYPDNRGKGYAVRTGLLAARGAIRIFTDVDLAYPMEDVLRVAQAIRSGAQVAIGSRTHPDSRVQLPMHLLGYAFRRVLQGRLFGAAARLLLPISTRDTQAGLKGMTSGVVDSVLPHLTCNGFGFDCEFLAVCDRAGIRLEEVPVCVRYTDVSSTTSPRSGLRMLRELWRIRRTWRGRPVPAFLPATALSEGVRPQPSSTPQRDAA
jgi:glycosyltransferase involved in cell wall biosynthesis